MILQHTQGKRSIHLSNYNLLPISNAVLFSIIFIVSLSFFTGNLSYAETGTGKDVFKVILSIFDISHETGDIVTTVTVNGNSKVRSFDSDMYDFTPGNNTGDHFIEYIATFPGEEVKPGDAYKACILVLETTKSICHEGTNSLGKRPEVVDIALLKAGNTNSEEADADTEEANSEEADSEEADTPASLY